MGQYLIYGGLAAIFPQLYSDVAAAAFSASSGQVNLPSFYAAGTSATWMAWLALAGFLLLILGLFL